MYRLRFRLVGFFVEILLLALLLTSGFVALLCASYVDGELLAGQRALGQTAHSLNERTDLTPGEIGVALSSSDYNLHTADAAMLGEDERERLQGGEEVVGGFFLNRSLFFMLGDQMMVVETYPATSLLITSLLRSMLACVLLVFIGFWVVYALSRRIVQPIVNLSEATHQVAKGNFDVAVDTHMPRFTGGIREIAELADNFNHMAHELKNVDYLQRDFTANLSHELKTPVASISGYTRLLACEGLTAEAQREYLHRISEESARLSTLSDNLLRLTRLESHPPLYAGDRFKLDEQLRRAIAALLPAIERKAIELAVDLARVTIHANETLLMQVWTNLLDNAVKFTPDGGRIEVTLGHLRGEARVTIRDSGIGMDEATIGRIFEKFYQADSSHHGSGNGLGLPLAKRIVDISRGRIDVTSSVGAGSCFTVVLPEK